MQALPLPHESRRAKPVRWIAVVIGLIGIACSLLGALRSHGAVQASAREHREFLETAIRAPVRQDGKADCLVKEWRLPEPDRVARILDVAGFISFVLLSLLLVVVKDARSGFSILLWLALFVPNMFAGLTD